MGSRTCLPLSQLWWNLLKDQSLTPFVSQTGMRRDRSRTEPLTENDERSISLASVFVSNTKAGVLLSMAEFLLMRF